MKEILVLDGSVWSRPVIQAALKTDYRVILAEKPAEALRVCKMEQPDLLIADNYFDDSFSGIQIACRAHVIAPAMPLLIMSALPPECWPGCEIKCFHELAKTSRFAFLQKPFTARTLRTFVADLIRGDYALSA
jgi:DNA-binding NtrC family response regulator